MPNINPTVVKLAPIVGGLAVAVVGGVAVFSGGNSAQVKLDARDTSADTYDEAPLHSDLLSEPVAPGATVTTGVTLPAAHHTVGVALNGSAANAFVVTNVTEVPTDDGTGVWLSVTAQNTSQKQLRLTAEIAYGPQLAIAVDAAVSIDASVVAAPDAVSVGVGAVAP